METRGANMSGDYCEYHSPRLQTELERERELKEKLEESVSDLRSTTSELQERLHSVDGEGNEWKTRYEVQTELNGQLERQTSIIRERMVNLRGNPVDRLAAIRSFDNMSIEALRQHLKLLTEEKADLQTQLKDCQLSIAQEGKAFHKTNDERRAYLSEIAKMSSTLEGQRRQSSTRPKRANESKQRRAKQASRKADADSEKGKKRDKDGGGVRANEEDGGGAAVERREEKKSHEESKLPTLKYSLKHSA